MGETMEDEDLSIGRASRRQRLSRRLLARMLGGHEEAGEGEEGEESLGGEEGGDQDRRLVRLLIGSRILRKRRLRRLMLAHLLHERSEAEDEGEEGEEGFGEEEGGTGEHKLARLLIASGILRRRRVRRAILAHLLRDRGEAEDEGEEGEEGFGEEEGGNGEHKLARLLIASRILRKRRVRRALLGHLLREKREEAEA